MPSEKWNDETIHALMTFKKVLGLIGVWPLEIDNYMSFSRWSVATMLQISTIVSLSLEVYRHCAGADDTMDAFLMDLSNIVSLSKIILIRVNWRHTLALVRSIIDDWSVHQEPRHREIMLKYTNKGRIVALTILYLGYASGASFALKSVPLEHILPWSNNTRANRSELEGSTYFLATQCVFGTVSIYFHVCILLFQAAQIFVNATAHCGNDGFFFAVTMHLCGQFEILKTNFSELGATDTNCHGRMRELVKRHCHLAKLAHHLDNAFTLIILVQLFMSSLLLCVEGFQMIVSLKLNDTIGAMKHAVLIVTMLVQLFLYSFASDALQSQTAGIPFAAYDCPWYNFDASITRDLSLVVFHGSTPERVTAGGFITINLRTFKDILKASVSYLSVLRVMLE